MPPAANPPETPGDRIRRELAERGWTQEKLAMILGRHRPEITGIVSGRRGVTGELAVGLARALGGCPEDWLTLENARQLSLIEPESVDREVARRLRVFESAPIQEMQRRGWLPVSKDVEGVERDLCSFFDVPSLDQEPSIGIAARRPNEASPYSAEQRAWACRALQVARAMPMAPFDESRGKALVRKLRQLAAYPDEIRHVPGTLAQHGIRFVIVEALPGGAIDGASMWIDDETPVIAMTMRHDRVDWFWFTLMHEVAHVLHRDALSIDDGLVGVEGPPPAADDIEARANAEASGMLVPRAEMESFINRVGPLYSRDRVVQFAKRVKIHPGIVVGQLHHRKEIKPHALRALLVKVRDHILQTAVCDGWNRTVGNI